MFSIFDGEKYFDNQGVIVNPKENIILDIHAKFSLKKLDDYTIFDAYSAMLCAKKCAKENEIIKLIYPKKFNLINKNCFYLQYVEFEKEKYNLEKSYFVEDIIAKICSSIVDEKIGWIYVARHKDLRIICGIGRGIIFSRHLSDADIELEIEKTILYLKRFKLTDKFKVFRNFEGLPFTENKDKRYEEYLIDFAEKYPTNPIKDISIFLWMNQLLYLIVFILFVIGGYLHYENGKFPNYIFEKEINNGMNIKINEGNINDIDKFFSELDVKFVPWLDLAEIYKEHGSINPYKISLTPNENRIFLQSENISLKKNEFIENKNGEKILCIKK